MPPVSVQQPEQGSALPDSTVSTVVITVAIGFLVLGLVITAGRYALGGAKDPAESFVRSWIGLALNGGLLLACAATLGTSDTALRNTLFGGLIAGAGAASAFYFASSGSDQARRDILTASLPAVLVPDLEKKSPAEAQAIIAKLPLRLELPENSGNSGNSTSTVATQSPKAGSTARPGDVVTATLS